MVPPAKGKTAAVVIDPKVGDIEPEIYKHLAKDVLSLAIFIRFINAICIATFFQPDEYFQSLEPAWKIAFGAESGAWITWEWMYQLRSSLHPVLFALVYWLPDKSMDLLFMFPQFRAMILVYLPRIVQGLFAAAGDFYTWKFAERVYGRGSYSAWTALLMTFFCPWQWFCSTRTFSNSLETVLTIVALNFWPWALAGDVDGRKTNSVQTSDSAPTTKTAPLPSVFQFPADVTNLRICLLLAGVACMLRPTNLLLWGSLVVVCITRTGLTGSSRATTQDFLILLREAIICGTAVITVSAISDRVYFGDWTFPPYQFLHFNITKSLAVFYGTNDWHYYLSQGLPLLLTTYLPFGLIALWSASSVSTNALPAEISNTRFQLSFMVLTTITTLSRISHKEVRFIYPLLPSLHVLAAPHVLAFFNATPLTETILNASWKAKIAIKSWRLYLLIALIITNLGIGIYTTQFHQRGVIDVVSFLRNEYENLHLTVRGEVSPIDPYDLFGDKHIDSDPNEMFVGFLMPCHSTPWRSHLFYPTLRAWALTCEPPLDIPAGTLERAAYRDEADRFYDDPVGFLKSEVDTKQRPWPRYIVGFEGIESDLKKYYEQAMPGFEVRRRWSGFNSHWHDDQRRKGEVVVWEFIDASRPQSRR